jgi:fused signal recognition particle receptor
MVNGAKKSWIGRLRSGLSRSAGGLSQGIAGIVSGRKLDRETLNDLEDLLITADMGAEGARGIVEAIAAKRPGNTENINALLAEGIETILARVIRFGPPRSISSRSGASAPTPPSLPRR